MKKHTHLADCLAKTEYESQYDGSAKELVSNKQVLARIVKGVTTEFADYDFSVIEGCIEGNPEVAAVNVYPGKSKKERINGMNTESKILQEGEIRYDIRFCAITPVKKERIKIILLEGGIRQMCNLSELVRERGWNDGWNKGRNEGRNEGLNEGQANLLLLISKMAADGMLESIPRLATDSEFFKKMTEKYAEN